MRVRSVDTRRDAAVQMLVWNGLKADSCPLETWDTVPPHAHGVNETLHGISKALDWHGRSYQSERE
jgi:hypothetical protein